MMLIKGPSWDAMDFLINSLEFAGQGVGYADLTRPPLVSFMASLLIRMGIGFEVALYAFTGFMYVFSVLGLYLFLRLRLNPYKSFFGCILFASFPLILNLVANGMGDLSSVAFSIWAMYFLVLAIQKNSKYFYLVFIMVMFAFLSRFPAALIMFPIVLYLLINIEKWNYRDLVIGLLISMIPLLPVLIFFYGTFSDPFYPFVYFLNQTNGYFITDHFSAYPDHLFYLKNLGSFGGASVGMLIIILAGAIVYFIRTIRTLTKQKYEGFNHLIYNKKRLIGISVIGLFLFIFTFGKIPYLISEIIFLTWTYVLYLLLKDRKLRYLDFNLLILSWFMAFFIFHSIHLVKVERYYATMAPAFTYFLILGLDHISNIFGIKIKNNINLTYYVISTFLIIIMLLSTISYFSQPYNQSPEEISSYTIHVLQASSSWLMGHDPSYQNKVIYADIYWPYFSLYLKTNVRPMPVFRDNKAYNYELKNYIIGPEENNMYNKELEKNNVDYYFSRRNGLNLTGYTAICNISSITLYEKT